MTGHEAFGVAKADSARDKRRNREGTALAGAGAATATTGLIAGGLPGAKSDFSSVFRMKPGQGTGVRRAASTARGATPAVKAVPGGILGFRVSAHKGGTYAFEEKAKANAQRKPKNAHDAFEMGRNEGKIAPEHRVMRGMMRGKKVANAALVGGAAATAYGLHHRKPSQPVSKSSPERKSDTYNSALLGAGAATTAATTAVPRYLDKHKKSYERSAARNVDQASKIVPSLGGRQGKRLTLKQMSKFRQQNGPDTPWPKTMYPEVKDRDAKAKLKGVAPRAAEAAGRLRGAAAQERHFAEVIGNTSRAIRSVRTPAAVAAGVGAGGLAVNQNRKRQAVAKSAFGVTH